MCRPRPDCRCRVQASPRLTRQTCCANVVAPATLHARIGLQPVLEARVVGAQRNPVPAQLLVVPVARVLERLGNALTRLCGEGRAPHVVTIAIHHVAAGVGQRDHVAAPVERVPVAAGTRILPQQLQGRAIEPVEVGVGVVLIGRPAMTVAVTVSTCHHECGNRHDRTPNEDRRCGPLTPRMAHQVRSRREV